MSKSIKKQRPKEKLLTEEALYEAAKRMNGKEPVVMFIDTLLTESERNIIGRRILISQMILAGKTQAEIRSEFSVSPNTFTRTRKWLVQQIPHYDTAIKEYKAKLELEKQAKSMRKSKYSDPLSFTSLRHKYPGHFLFFNIADEILKRK